MHIDIYIYILCISTTIPYQTWVPTNARGTLEAGKCAKLLEKMAFCDRMVSEAKNFVTSIKRFRNPSAFEKSVYL